MRLKKGFTLAEILIVLMVIGIISTMTIPSLMQGVTGTQFQTAFRKAYNVLSNIAAIERINGQLPSAPNSDNAYRFFAALTQNLSVKEYAASSGNNTFNAGGVLRADAYSSGVTIQYQVGENTITRSYGVDPASGSRITGSAITTSQPSPWVVSDDNMAYSVLLPAGASTCADKITINSQANMTDALSHTCAVVVVDVNGLSQGPNLLDAQVTGGIADANAAVATLTGDQYYILVANDGIAAGPKATTLSGRLAGGLN